MPLYEHVFLARQDVSAQQVETLTEQMTGVITDNGGSVGKKEYWGLRPLSFRIKKNRKAHYQLIDIDAPAAAVAEMERQMTLNDDILRFMTIRVEEHTDQPSAILTRRDRDDRRGGRGDRPDRGPRGDRGGDSRPPRREENQQTEKTEA